MSDTARIVVAASLPKPPTAATRSICEWNKGRPRAHRRNLNGWRRLLICTQETLLDIKGPDDIRPNPSIGAERWAWSSCGKRRIRPCPDVL